MRARRAVPWVLLGPLLAGGPGFAEDGFASPPGLGPAPGWDARACSTAADEPAVLLDCRFTLEPRLQLRLSHAERASGATDAPSLEALLESAERRQALRSLGQTERLAEAPRLPGDPAPDARHGTATRLALEGRRGAVDYWAQYRLRRSAGPRGSSLEDAALGSIGARWNLGYLEPELELSRVQEDRGGQRPFRETASTAKLSLDVAAPSWPTLNLAYARQSNRSQLRRGAAFDEGSQQTKDVLSGTLWYGRTRWDAYLTSAYATIRGQDGSASDVLFQDYLLGGSLRPTDALTIVPYLEFTRSDSPRSKYWMETLAASLGLYHSGLARQLTVSLDGSYFESRDGGGFVDNRSLDAAFALERKFEHLFGLRNYRSSLTFTILHSRYTDLAYPDADSTVSSAFLTLEIVL